MPFREFSAWSLQKGWKDSMTCFYIWGRGDHLGADTQADTLVFFFSTSKSSDVGSEKQQAGGVLHVQETVNMFFRQTSECYSVRVGW